MPPGMASGKDAEKIAKWIANGMESKSPTAFAACSSCHGTDGKGLEGMSPNLTKRPLLGIAKKIRKWNELIDNLENSKYNF